MAVDPNIKVLDLHLAVADPRLEVVDLKQEVPERRSGGIRPNLTSVRRQCRLPRQRNYTVLHKTQTSCCQTMKRFHHQMKAGQLVRVVSANSK